jgi:hypothetical protein
MYERLAHRPLNSSESVISVGGRLAVHRGPRVHGATVTTVGGKKVSTSEGLVADNETYVALDATDVLNISCSSGSADWAELCSAVVSTLTLAK